MGLVDVRARRSRMHVGLLAFLVATGLASGAAAHPPCAQNNPWCQAPRFAASTPRSWVWGIRLGWWHVPLSLRGERFDTEVDGATVATTGRDLGYDTPSANGVSLEVSVHVARRFGATLQLAGASFTTDAPRTASGHALGPGAPGVFQAALGPSVVFRLGPVLLHGAALLGYRNVGVAVHTPPTPPHIDCDRAGCGPRAPWVSTHTFVLQPRLGADVVLPGARSFTLSAGASVGLDVFPSPAPQVVVHLSLADVALGSDGRPTGCASW